MSARCLSQDCAGLEVFDTAKSSGARAVAIKRGAEGEAAVGSSVGLAASEEDSGVAPSMLRRSIIRPICRPSALAPLVERRSVSRPPCYALPVRKRSARRRRRGMCSQRSCLQV